VEPTKPATEPVADKNADKPATGAAKTAKASKVSIDGTDISASVTIEATHPTSVILVGNDPAGDDALERAVDSVLTLAEAVIIAGTWKGKGIAYRNKSRTPDDRLRVAIGVRS